MEQLLYHSTRGGASGFSASEAIFKGIAPDGGLFVPDSIPKIDIDAATLGYQDLAVEILKRWLSDYSLQELADSAQRAYSEKFETELIAPVTEHAGYYFLELYHGKTLAFKDMALCLLPHLMKHAARRRGPRKKTAILTATSGDTGKAALEAFSGISDIDIVVFFPNDGVSDMQKLQMQTQEGENVFVAGVRGNFDDTQTEVKRIFSDPPEGFSLSSANSINIGRLVPQIVYYFYAYGQMVENGALNLGEKINFTVPTGNFGNILAGWYAKEMGLPVNKLICASNDNKVLYDFFSTGVYDKNREFVLTASPSMDILISSNLERLICHLSGEAETRRLMESLLSQGRYAFTHEVSGFAGGFASGERAKQGIGEMFGNGYLIDPHTAVAYEVYKSYRESNGDETPNVILSTANPFKFPESVLEAIDPSLKGKGAMESAQALSLMSGLEIPRQLRELERKEKRHETVCDRLDMKKVAAEFLNRRNEF
ncbi:MAG: threonine synthase [Clostridiales bacterium]|jgi:threonine synthase|nr:threonine synthase [Clostridiales bacterium]